MLCAILFVEGKFRYGSEGAIYSKCPKYSFPVTSDNTFEDVKGMIYSRIGSTEDQYGLDMKTRIDTGKGSKYYFQLIPITDQEGWEMTYQMFLSSGVPVIELYVELVPSVTGFDKNSVHNSGYDNYVAESEHVLEPTPELAPEPMLVCVSQPRPQSQPRTQLQSSQVYEPQPRSQPVQETEPDVSVDAVPDEYLDSGDQFGDGNEKNWDTDNLSDGRTSRHPVKNFNGMSAFEEVDVAFSRKSRVFENKLSPGQIFASRALLKNKISEFHVENNIECKWQKTDKSRMVVVCKDNCCDFRLFAKPQGIGEAWIIKKCPVPHSCRILTSRTKAKNEGIARENARVVAEASSSRQ